MITAMDVFHIGFNVSLSVSLDVSARIKKISPHFWRLFWGFKAQMTSNCDWMERESLLSSLLLLGPPCPVEHQPQWQLFSAISCCWRESVESFGRGAHLVWWRQKPSAHIKADISLWESGPRERELQYKLTMAAAVFSFFFFLFIVPSRCQPQQPLCPLWHPMAALLHHMKERRRGGVGSCRLGLGTWIQSWGAVSSSGVKVFSGEFLMCPTSWLFPDFSSASVEMSSAQFF